MAPFPAHLYFWRSLFLLELVDGDIARADGRDEEEAANRGHRLKEVELIPFQLRAVAAAASQHTRISAHALQLHLSTRTGGQLARDETRPRTSAPLRG